MADKFSGFARGLTSPAEFHHIITPSDDADLPSTPRALYCRAAGSVVLRDAAGVDVAYNLAAGQILPFRPVRVLATGTTASLVGWS